MFYLKIVIAAPHTSIDSFNKILEDLEFTPFQIITIHKLLEMEQCNDNKIIFHLKYAELTTQEYQLMENLIPMESNNNLFKINLDLNNIYQIITIPPNRVVHNWVSDMFENESGQFIIKFFDQKRLIFEENRFPRFI